MGKIDRLFVDNAYTVFGYVSYIFAPSSAFVVDLSCVQVQS
jgi:hypothetical protein